MNPSSTSTRPRVLGALVLIIVFAAGFLGGIAWRTRATQGVNVNVRMNTQIPRELRDLGLTPLQEDSLHVILDHAHGRMKAVLRAFGPQLHAVVDSADAGVRAVLSPSQRARFDAVHHPINHDEMQIDTTRR